MYSHEVWDHTADVGLRARADTFAELLVACGEGMFRLLVETDEPAEQVRELVAVAADDAQDLVHVWLRELLFLFDARHVVFHRFEVRSASATRARALCHGEPFDPARHRGRAEIKAVTYHDFRVERSDEGWTAQVLFDA